MPLQARHQHGVQNFAQVQGGPELLQSSKGGEAWPGFEPRMQFGELPAWPTPWGRAVPGRLPEGPVGLGRHGPWRESCGQGAGPQHRCSALVSSPHQKGSRTYPVGLPRQRGVTAGRGGPAPGGRPAGDRERWVAERDARPLERPQPLPGSLTPGAGRRPEAGRSPSV